MSPFVYLKILTPGEHLSAPGKRARERFLPSVHPDVVHQLVLGLEGPPVPRAILPKTRVRRALRPSDVFHRQMGHDLVHAGEVLPAGLPGRRLLRVHPQTLHLLLDRLPHVPEKRPVNVRGMMRHPHVGIKVLVMVGLRVVSSVVIRSGIEHLVVRRQVRVLMRSHLRVMVKENRVAGSSLRRWKLMVVSAQKEITSRVTSVRVQVPHVAVVCLEVVVLRPRADFSRSHGRRGVLVRRRNRRGTSLMPRTHF